MRSIVFGRVRAVLSRADHLRQLFESEARERLAQLTAGALSIERGESEADLPGSLFRAAHTIKGGARMLGLDDSAAAAERAEALLVDFRDGLIDATPGLGGALLAAIDVLRQAIWPSVSSSPVARAHGETPAGALLSPAARQADLRIAAARVDVVVALVAEARRVAARAAAAGVDRATDDVLAAAEEAALRLRLVPLSGLFGDLKRAVRDAPTTMGRWPS